MKYPYFTLFCLLGVLCGCWMSMGLTKSRSTAVTVPIKMAVLANKSSVPRWTPVILRLRRRRGPRPDAA